MTTRQFLVEVMGRTRSTTAVNVAQAAARPSWNAYAIDVSDLPAKAWWPMLTRAVAHYANNHGIDTSDWVFDHRQDLGDGIHALTYLVDTDPAATVARI